MLRRRLGPAGPHLSQLTFGTMRLEERVDDRSASKFLCQLHDDGVDTHHSSSEYDTHSTYLEALKTARSTGRSFQHIVKLACPSFDADRFAPQKLSTAVDSELDALGTEQLSCVQWLVRTPDAADQQAHVNLLTDQAVEIDNTLQQLLASGKVGAFANFPYSVAAAEAAAQLESVVSLCVYLNMIETDYVPFLETCDLLAIRPLAAGRLVHETDTLGIGPAVAHADSALQASLQFPLLHPNVKTVITSLRSQQQATTAIEAVAELAANSNEFDRIYQLLPEQ